MKLFSQYEIVFVFFTLSNEPFPPHPPINRLQFLDDILSNLNGIELVLIESYLTP